MESNQDVFISHSSVDSKLAYAMCDYLEEKGIRCWVAPRDIQGGTEYAEAIIMGIRNCKIMVVLFNKNANDSIYVKNEVERAFNYKSMLIPFKLDQTIPSAALELFLGSVHSLDATKGNPEDCFDLLYQNCVRSLGKKENSIKVKPVLPKTTEKKENSVKEKSVNYHVAETDYPKELGWDEANKATSTIGEGWRLPSKEELNEIYLNKEKFNIKIDGAYWSSSETEDEKNQSNFLGFSKGKSKNAWLLDFTNGEWYDFIEKSAKYKIRFVKNKEN